MLGFGMKPLQRDELLIGRRDEISLFETMLGTQSNAKWIMNLWGQGGIGKTQLLRRFAMLAAHCNDTLVTHDLVDLYWTTNQRELGILKSIADQLDPKQFERFYAALKSYQDLLAQSEPDPHLVLERANRTHARFIEAYRSLPAKRIVLLFDTAELATDAILRFWQETVLELRRIHANTLVVIAGRQPVQGLPDELVTTRLINAFSTQEVGEYLSGQGIDLPPDSVARIAELTKGRPILLGLTIDWIRFGNAPKDLLSHQPDQFEQAMVQRILQLRSPEDRAILTMAQFYRRFDEDMLTFVLKLEPEEAKAITQSLSRLSFVKYRPPVGSKVGSCTLHDEMRDLVNRYVWPTLDPYGTYRSDQSQVVVEYYKCTIDVEKDALEKQNLELERLFYWLDMNLEDAFGYSSELFGHAMDRYDKEFMEAIEAEVGRKKPLFSVAMRDESEFRQAVIRLRHERFSEAISALTELSSREHCEPALRASVQARLVEAHSYAGDPESAIAVGLESEHWFEELLSEMPANDPRQRRIERDFGWLSNSLGFAYRTRNMFDRTVDYYRKALIHLTAVGAYSQIASTKNNLGYVYHRQGQDDKALTECETALSIRLKLKSPDQLGYSYNTFGIIRLAQARGEEAISYFEKALRAFDEAESDRGQALVYVSYGRLMRQWGLLKERQKDETHDPEREQYLKASYMLDEAIKGSRQIGDLANLTEALNEKGTLLRQQRRWAEAIECFNESATLAHQIGNLYREADNSQDIGILHHSMGKLDEAFACAQRASDIAQKEGFLYLFARSQRTLANIRFERGNYDEAFEFAGNALVSFVKLDPEAASYSAALRQIFRDEWMDWICETLILKLPSEELAQQKCDYLIRRWEAEESGGQRLVDLYPGFIPRMRDLAQNYPFLTSYDEQESKQ